MAAKEDLRFKGLPFHPSANQVFYIENGYDTEANDFIRRNYDGLKEMFCRNGMKFYYLPYLLREYDIEAKVMYYAPYLSPESLTREVRSSELAQFIADDEDRRNLQPAFVFGASDGECGTDETRFLRVLFADIDTGGDAPIQNLERQVLAAIGRRHSMCYSRAKRKFNWLSGMTLFSCDDGSVEPDDCRPARANIGTRMEEERTELTNTAEILAELRRTVERLRLEGVSLMAIHEYIDKQEPLSQMVITPDYRIMLPDYKDVDGNDLEIEMGALPKAIYFLFLRYPEGIIYKHIQDYYAELLNIYRQLRPCTDDARVRLTITKVTNPLGNALNENLARIRKAFVEKFDEHLACNYIVTGERGAKYSIPLDRKMIVWQE